LSVPLTVPIVIHSADCGRDGGQRVAGNRGRRERRRISEATASWLWPLFRFSPRRDAYVLRIVGNRVGPVLEIAVPPRRVPDLNNLQVPPVEGAAES